METNLNVTQSETVPRMNQAGQVIGSYINGAFPSVTAFIWSKATGLQTLGSLSSGCSTTAPAGINNLGQVVGGTIPCGGTINDAKSFFWQSGKMFDLSQLVTALARQAPCSKR